MDGKVPDAEYQRYLTSFAEDFAQNPELRQAIFADKTAVDTMVHHFTTNESARRALMRTIVSDEEALQTWHRVVLANEKFKSLLLAAIRTNDDGMWKLLCPELFKIWKQSRQP